ncbi:hypothetical protein HDV00_000531 [Rhizophlyctis rosea]|nr:hypothetical protein HDV00_000531 [Rhizophlyctis rosea]
MSDRVTRSKAKASGAADTAGKDDRAEPPVPSSNEVSQETKGNTRKRSQKAAGAEPETKGADETHKDKKAKAIAETTPDKPVKALKIGDTIPDVELVNDAGETVTLHSLVKDAGAIFFIYPRANTPGITPKSASL